jgi:hypothetical protein
MLGTSAEDFRLRPKSRDSRWQIIVEVEMCDGIENITRIERCLSGTGRVVERIRACDNTDKDDPKDS